MKKQAGWMLILLAALLLLAYSSFAEDGSSGGDTQQLAAPVIEGVLPTMEVGQALDFTVTTDGRGLYIQCEITDADGNSVYWTSSYNKNQWSFHADEGIFDPGMYTLKVTAEDMTWEYQPSSTTVEFSVTGQRAPGPSVSIQESVVLDEDGTFVFTQSGITEMRYRYDSTYSSFCSALEITETGAKWVKNFSSEGEQTFSFSAKVNGTWTAWTEPVTVSVIPRGTLDPAEIDMKTEYLAGEPVSLNLVGCDHADYYFVSYSHGQLLDSVTAGTYTVLPAGLDAGSYTVRVVAFGKGYLSSTSEKEITVTGERPAAPAVTMPEGSYGYGDYLPVRISAENIQAAAISDVSPYQPYEKSIDVYLGNSGAAVIPVPVSYWEENYSFRALINGYWSERTEEISIRAEYDEPKDYPDPEISFASSLERGQPLEVAIDSVAQGAEYYAYTVAWQYGEGEYDAENIFYEHVFDPSSGTLTIPEYAFPHTGTYHIAVMYYMKDGYAETRGTLTVYAGSEPQPGPAVTMLTEKPMTYSDIRFQVATAGAEKLSCVIRLENELNPEGDPKIIELDPGATSYIYTYRPMDDWSREISFSLYDGNAWTAYSSPLVFKAEYGQDNAADVQINSLNWPAEIEKGEELTVEWDVKNVQWFAYDIYKKEGDDSVDFLEGTLDGSCDHVTFDTSEWPEAGIYNMDLYAYVPGDMFYVPGRESDSIRFMVRDSSSDMGLTVTDTELDEGGTAELIITDPWPCEYLCVRVNGKIAGYQYKGKNTGTWSISWPLTETGTYVFDVCGTNASKTWYTTWSSSVQVNVGFVEREISEANFPDDAFRNFIIEQGYDQDGNGVLSVEELTAVTRIECYEKQIADLRGIGFFPSLNYLDCHSNQLTELNLSENTDLYYLGCHDNRLTELDFSGNTMLQYLDCSHNQLTHVVFGETPWLSTVSCHNNQLTSLDTSGFGLLSWLSCGTNQLTELDVSQNPELYYLDCMDNQLTSLDVSGNPALERLNCPGNQLTSLGISGATALAYLDCSENQLTELDLSGAQALTDVNCAKNQLKTLNISSCKELETMYCSENQLSVLNLEGNMALKGLFCGHNQFIRLDISCVPALVDAVMHNEAYQYEVGVSSYGRALSVDSVTTVITEPIETAVNEVNFPDSAFRQFILEKGYDQDGDGILTESELTAVTEMDCSGRGIADLQGVGHFYWLTSLNCSNNMLTTLDVSHFAEMRRLDCSGNQLTELDVNGLRRLKELNCRDNLLTEMNRLWNLELEVLDCSGNRLTVLDVPGSEMTKLDCSGNQLTELYVTWMEKLTELDCSDNQLTGLDVSINTLLTALNCSGNQLSEMDVSSNTQLKSFRCFDNQLTELNVSGNGNLLELDCGGNRISNLNTSGCTALETLLCESNQLTELDLSGTEALRILDCSGNQLLRLRLLENPLLLETVQNGEMTETDSLRTYESEDSSLTVDKEIWLILELAEGVALNETNFPDAFFRLFLQEGGYDKNHDDILTAAELTEPTEMDCSACQIEDLTGIGYFTSLKMLNCERNRLVSLDLSRNTAVRNLNCGYNSLTELDLRWNPYLTDLTCNGNQIGTIDISGSAALVDVVKNGTKTTGSNYYDGTVNVIYLDGVEFIRIRTDEHTELLCEGTVGEIALNETNFPDEAFRSFIASQGYDADDDQVLCAEELSAVKEMDCSDSGISDLTGIEFFTSLEVLNCSDNLLSSLFVYRNTKLTELSCGNNGLTVIDVSSLHGLIRLDCHGNQLTGLELSQNPGLEDLYCHENRIEELNISQVPGLLDTVQNGTVAEEDEWITYSGETEGTVRVDAGTELILQDDQKGIPLDASAFPDDHFLAFIQYSCYDQDEDGYLSAEELSAVTALNCQGRGIVDLTGIHYFTSLRVLYCENNPLESLDLSRNRTITNLNCGGTSLSSLDLRRNTSLEYLSCRYSELNSLEVGQNSVLRVLSCGNNSLTSLDVTQCTALTTLDCSTNQLTSLDVRRNLSLTTLDCSSNFLTSLDVRQNSALKLLTCNHNELTSLDVTLNPALETLTCSGNQLNELDVRNNGALHMLQCAQMELTSLNLRSNHSLTYLDCSENRLTGLDLSGNQQLEYLYCAGNLLTALDISQLHLSSLSCGSNQISSLDISQCPLDGVLLCAGNQISTLDFSNHLHLVDIVLNGEYTADEYETRAYPSRLDPSQVAIKIDADTALVLIDEENAIRLPEGLIEIGSEAFAGIPATEIVIPRSVTSIAEDAFDNCNIQAVFGYAGTAAETFAGERFYKLGD